MVWNGVCFILLCGEAEKDYSMSLHSNQEMNELILSAKNQGPFRNKAMGGLIESGF